MPRVQHRRGKPRVVPVQLRLTGTVRVHLKEALRIDLAAIVVVPARVDDTAVIGDRGIIRVHLVKRQLPQVPAVSVAGEQVADLGPPAVDGLHAPSGVEDDIAAWQVRAFVVGVSQARSELSDLTIRNGHFVKVIVIFGERLFPAEQDALAVGRSIRIPNDTRLVLQQSAS